MSRQRGSISYASALVAIAVAGMVSVGGAFAAGGNVAAGGSVVAEPPAFLSFAGNRETADNSGTSIAVLAGTLRSPNGENALTGGKLVLRVSGPESAEIAHRITGAEARASSEPESADGGWKVWSETSGDGVVRFSILYAFPRGMAPGTYTLTPVWQPTEREDADDDEKNSEDGEDERDAREVLGTPVTVVVSTFKSITLSGEPVDPLGRTSGQLNWGMWTARPGQTNVESTNYIRIVNSGQDARQGIVIDFTGAEFVGANGQDRIPVAANLEFAVCQLADSKKVPADCASWSFKGSTADGSTSERFGGLGHVMYVKYRVKQIPDIVAAQTYSTAFTVDKL